MGQAFDDQPRSWGPLFSGLPRREGPDHTALLDFLEQMVVNEWTFFIDRGILISRLNVYPVGG